MKQLIKNVHILTMDAVYTEYRQGYVLIDNQQIAAIGSVLTGLISGIEL